MTKGMSDRSDDMENDKGEDIDKDNMEIELQKAVFGDDAGFHERVKEHGLAQHNRSREAGTPRGVEDWAEVDVGDLDDADLFILDSGPSRNSLPPTSSRKDREPSPEAAWHDSDDDHVTVSLQSNPRLRKLRVYEDEDLIRGTEYAKRLRRQYELLNPTPDWAKQALAEAKTRAEGLNGGDLEAFYRPSHESTSGDESVDSDELRASPLSTLFQQAAAFVRSDHGVSNDGTKIVFAGRRRYFHTWDLSSGKIDKVSRIHGHQKQHNSMERFKISPCGRWLGLVGSQRKGGGLINVLNAHTNQWIAEVRVEGKGGVADFAWWANGEGMTVLGKAGEAVEWDGGQKSIVGRWMDEGAVGTTVVAMGGRGSGGENTGGDRWVAVGSSSGVVNIYDRNSWGGEIPASPQPTRVFDQLTTPISHLVFSQDGQLMIIASRWKRDALRLVHLPSCTVYKNWPTSSTPLGRITSVAFAPASDMFAIANEQGKIRLWEVRG
ncbi:MAG: hypothetical protein LQ346_003041 [Caloplaca aetnensis]|nr:MAG: hypothetical protein LQ346_003041 [Caloplaca aetnensis]